MTTNQRKAIDRMTELQLRKQLSIMIGISKDTDTIEYIEQRLSSLCTDTALVEYSEIDFD